MAETFASPEGHLRHRRHHLPQAGQALRRRPAAVLRRPGQEGQLPGRRLGPLRQPRRATTRWTCGSTCPSAGWPTRSGWTRPGVPEARAPAADQGRRSPWSCSTGPRPRGCRAGWSWPTPATASRGRSATAWPQRGPALHRRRHRRDGRLHRGAALGSRPRPPAAGGRPRTRPRLAEGSPRPVSLRELAEQDAAAEGDLARGDQGEAVGPVRLAAGLAGRRLGDGRLRRGRADLAADRGAGRRQDQVRLQQPAGGHEPDARRSGCGRAAGRWSRAISR